MSLRRAPADPFRSAMVALAFAYVAFAVLPFAWTFGRAALERLPEMGGLLKSAPAWLALGRSVVLGGLAAVGSFLLGAPLAFLTARTDLPLRRGIALLATAPLALPPYVLALALRPWLPRSPLVASGVVLALSLYPIAFLFVRAGLASIDPSLETAAVVMRGRARALWRITWPLLSPWRSAALTLTFLLGLGEFGVPALLGVPVYPGLIALRFAATYDAAGAAAAALPLLGFVGLTLRLEREAFRRSFESRLQVQDIIPLGAWKNVTLLFPAAVILLSPGLVFSSLAEPVDGRTLSEALRMTRGPLVNSLILGLSSSLIAVAVGFALARLRRGRSLATLLFVTPGTILGVALIGFWNRSFMPPLYGTLSLLGIALVVRYSALTERAIAAGLQHVPASQEEVGRVLGRSEWAIVRRVLLPQIAPAVVGGALLFLLFALRDLDTVVAIYPPGGETVIVRLYTVLANAPPGLQASIALIQTALAIPVVMGIGWAARRTKWRT